MDASDKTNLKCATRQGQKGLQMHSAGEEGIHMGSLAQLSEELVRSR